MAAGESARWNVYNSRPRPDGPPVNMRQCPPDHRTPEGRPTSIGISHAALVRLGCLHLSTPSIQYINDMIPVQFFFKQRMTISLP